VKRSVRRDKRQWVDELAQKAEEAEKRGDLKELYSITKKLSRKGFNRNKPLRNKSGEIISTQEEQLMRWKEHFSELLNKDIGQDVSYEESQRKITESDPRIDIRPPTRNEVETALKQIKGTGTDNIPSDVLKEDMDTNINILLPLLEKIWNEEKVPKEWKEGLIVRMPKKGDITNCNNWQGIILLSAPSKILSRIILNRMKDVVEVHLWKEQAGFQKHQNCLDLINTLRIILEQNAEWQTALYRTFIDSEKAFDSLNRTVCGKLYQSIASPQRSRILLKKYTRDLDVKCFMKENLIINNDVGQGCILSPIIYLLVLDNIMRKALSGRKRGIQWNIRDRLEDLEFADDICLPAQRLTDMKEKLKRLQREAELAGKHIPMEMTELQQ
jgi:hypothetical protein